MRDGSTGGGGSTVWPGRRGGAGVVGLISSVTQPFCASCTRARLTADGRLRLCLLRDMEVDLLTPHRAGASRDELRELILGGIWNKPWGHGLAEEIIPLGRAMNEIGGEGVPTASPCVRERGR